MNWKILLPGLVLFPGIIAKELSPLQKNIVSKNVFDFTKVNHRDHKKSTSTASFRETNKKNNGIDTAALKKSNWYAAVMKNIESGEYEINRNDKTGIFSAPNRKQQLSASFAYNGFTLQPINIDENWTLKILLSGLYADNKLMAQTLSSDLPARESNKIVFNNALFSTEYINSKEGVRQNFIIQKEPAVKPKKINIKLQTGKGWYINKVQDKELHFAKLEGELLNKKITYNSLKVWDANKKELPARFTVNKNHTAFEIEVNANDAVYPITIDPISSTPVATLECNLAGAGLGSAVASAGDVNGDGYSDVIVGAPLYTNPESFEGAFFIYHGSATGISTTPALTVESNIINARLGYSVATAGDVNNDGYSDVIVGASQYTSGESNEGAFYVYHGSATGINLIPVTFVQSNLVNGFMGWSVATAGDVNGDGFSDIVVGYAGYSNGEIQEGGAYIYHGSAAGINITVAAIVEGNQASDGFGQSVASAGDVNGDGYSDIIIGAKSYDSGETDEGAAFVYHGGPGGINIVAAAMVQSNLASALMGYSVSSAGDVNGDGYSDVIVGTAQYTNGENMEGAAFIYHGSVTGISTTAAAMVQSNQITAFLGFSVSAAGDVNGDGYSDVIAGGWGYDNGQADEGGAFLFLGSSTGINTTASAIRESEQAGGGLGTVSCAGDVNGDGYSDLILGASGYNNPEIDEGAAFVYHGSPDGLKTTNNWTTESNSNEANYGLSVASAGDVNSDGFSDVVVGAYIFTSVNSRDGKAFLYLGSATGLSVTTSWTGIGTMANEYFGSCVAGAGDVNGDGYGDVLVGAYGYTNSQSEEGRAYLYYGSAGGLAIAAAWTYENNIATSILGRSLAAAGDVNGDGYGDIIIGGPQFTGPDANEGIVYLFYGSSTVPASTPAWSTEGNQPGAFYGFGLASLGDVNADGYSDIIIGAHTYDSPDIDEGKVFAFYGSAAGLAAVANWTAEINQANAQFGVSVASAGDVNGDGYSDAIIGSYLYDNPTADEGAVFVYYGSSTGLSLTANWTAESNIASSFFGYTASSAGDVNGDGYSDVLVGAREISNGQAREGAMYAYYGSSTGLSLSTSWYVESNVAGILLGNSVASAGDVNGDGYSDVIGGAPYYANPTYREGAAFVYYGNNNTGLRHNLKLYNTDLTTPINQSNKLVPNLFGAGLFSKSPFGRVKGKLVWEVKKQGFAFSGVPITNSTASLGKQPSFTDLGIAGTELKYNVQKQGFQNKIRVRVEYDKVTAINGQIYGPWRYPAAYLQGAHGMNAVPLPVKLNSFAGALIADKVKLQWSSSDDVHVLAYQIERSGDNRKFTAIGGINSFHQNSRNYDFTDNQPLKGKSWYRLRIKEESGQTGYSKTVLIKNNNDAVLIYPTVISKGEQLNLQFKSSVTGSIEIQLVDMKGATVFNKVITTNGNILSVQLPSLPSGVYFLSATQNGEKLITQQIIIR